MSADHGAHGGAQTTNPAQDLGIDTSATGVQRRPRLVPVSALFEHRALVDRALPRLTGAGVPRDLIEVVVSPEAARRHYAGVRAEGTRETARFAGIGGLVGLLIGIAVSLVFVSLPEFVGPGAEAVVQLIGPNFATITGAVLGALVGAFRHRPPRTRHARAAESPDAVVVVVRARGEAQVATVLRLLADAGGRAPRIETVKGRGA